MLPVENIESKYKFQRLGQTWAIEFLTDQPHRPRHTDILLLLAPA